MPTARPRIIRSKAAWATSASRRTTLTTRVSTSTCSFAACPIRAAFTWTLIAKVMTSRTRRSRLCSRTCREIVTRKNTVRRTTPRRPRSTRQMAGTTRTTFGSRNTGAGARPTARSTCSTTARSWTTTKFPRNCATRSGNASSSRGTCPNRKSSGSRSRATRSLIAGTGRGSTFPSCHLWAKKR